MKTRYDAVQHESEQRLALAAAKEAVKQAEDLINGKDPANMSNEDMAAVIAAYTAAETAVNQLDDSNAGKAELKTRLAALKKTVEQIEAKYAQKVIEDIFSLVCILLANPLLRLLQVPEEILPIAVK